MINTKTKKVLASCLLATFISTNTLAYVDNSKYNVWNYDVDFSYNNCYYQPSNNIQK